MLLYNKYIIKKTLLPALLISLSISGVIWLTQLVGFFDLVTEKGLGVLAFFSLALFLLPSILLVVFPIGLFCATLFAINNFTHTKELFALKAVGLSRVQLLKPFMIVGVFFMVISYIFTLYAVPHSYRKFSEKQEYIKNNYIAVALEEKVFNSPVEDTIVYVDKKESSIMGGIFIYQQEKTDKYPTMITAAKGDIIQIEGLTRVVLYDGNRYVYNEENGILSQLSFQSYVTDLDFKSNENKTIKEIPLRALYVHELLDPPIGQVKIDSENKLFAELHQRIVWPLLTLLLPFVTVAILFHGEYNRLGNRKKNIVASSVVILIVMVNFALRSVTVAIPALASLLYLFILAIFAIFWLVTFRRKSI
jgi:lipopolysaccharide export system permease protein